MPSFCCLPCAYSHRATLCPACATHCRLCNPLHLTPQESLCCNSCSLPHIPIATLASPANPCASVLCSYLCPTCRIAPRHLSAVAELLSFVRESEPTLLSSSARKSHRHTGVHTCVCPCTHKFFCMQSSYACRSGMTADIPTAEQWPKRTPSTSYILRGWNFQPVQV
jgi:hypothetical protein